MRIEVELTDEMEEDIVCSALLNQIPYTENPKDCMAMIRTYMYFSSRKNWPALWDAVDVPDCLRDEYNDLKTLLGEEK